VLEDRPSHPLRAAAAPDWNVNSVMVSHESAHAVLTATYYSGDGNQSGSAVDEVGSALSREGYSFFAEAKPPRSFSVIGRYDQFDPDTHLPDDENDRVIAGVAWDMGKHNTWLLDYDGVFYPGDRKDDHRVQLTLQVSF
jgi:hypothetical protein